MIINGYRIIYIKNDKKITSIHGHVQVGSINETEKECGIAHLLEHVLIDSWVKCKESCTKYWSRKGIMINGKTESRHTSYFITGLSDKMPLDMYNYMSSILSSPRITQKCFNSSKSAVKDELLVRLNNPSWKIEREFYESINSNNKSSGYSRMANYDSKVRNLNEINVQDIINFYNKWYTPDNIFITVITNEDKNTVIEYFKKFLIKKDTKQPIYSPIKLHINRDNSVIKRPDAQKTTYIVGFIDNNPGKYDHIYYNLIQDILTGDLSSLLYMTLRDKLNLIYGIKMEYEITKSYTVTSFSVNCQIENSRKLLEELIKLLKNFIRGNFDSNLLQRSKDRLTINYRNICEENTEFLNNFYSSQYTMLNKIEFTPQQINTKVQGVSLEKLLTIVNKIIDFKNILIICETK